MKKALAIAALLLAAQAVQAGEVWKLYRTSPITNGDQWKVHVATFDANVGSLRGESYNGGNCDIVRDLMQSQPGVTVRYWCERTKEF